MKGQMHSERDIYHSQGIDGNNMGQVHYERNVCQNKCPNIEDYDIIYENAQSVFIMIEIVLAIWVTANPHHVMFSY
jgi:hypothetical protein